MRRREIKPITFNVERSLLFLLAKAHQVILTERGKELEKELGIAAHKVREKIKSEIHPNDIKTLGRLLKRLSR